MRTRESEMKRAEVALRWSSLWATPQCGARTVCWPPKVIMLIDKMNIAGQRRLGSKLFSLPGSFILQSCYRGKGEQLLVGRSMLKVARPVHELLWVSWALVRGRVTNPSSTLCKSLASKAKPLASCQKSFASGLLIKKIFHKFVASAWLKQLKRDRQ